MRAIKQLDIIEDQANELHFNSKMLTEKQLMKQDFSQQRFLLESLMQTVGVAALVGPPDSGKSQYCRQLAIAIAHYKNNFLGCKINCTHRKALIVATEDDQRATQWCLGKQLQGFNIEESSDNIKFLFCDTQTRDEIVEDIEKELLKDPCDLVVIDSFGDIYHGGDGNNNQMMRDNLKVFDKIAKKFKCLVLIVHHLRKSRIRSVPDQSDVLGAGSFVQKIRAVFDLRSNPQENNKKYLTVTKGNYISAEIKRKSLVLDFDERTLLFHRRNEILKDELSGVLSEGNRSSETSTIVDWEELFGEDEELQTHEILTRGIKIYGVASSSIERAKTDAANIELLIKVGHGKWQINRNHQTLKPSPPI